MRTEVSSSSTASSVRWQSRRGRVRARSGWCVRSRRTRALALAGCTRYRCAAFHVSRMRSYTYNKQITTFILNYFNILPLHKYNLKFLT